MIRTFRNEGAWNAYHYYVARTMERKDSDAMRLGRAFHVAMSEHDRWQEAVYIVPSTLEDDEFLAEVANSEQGRNAKVSLKPGTALNRRSPAHRTYEAMHRNAAFAQGKDFVDETELAKIRGQVASVYDNPICLDYLNQGFPVEKPCISTDPGSGLGIRALFDLLPDDGETFVDFKTTRHFVRDRVIADFYSRDKAYHGQGEHYMKIGGLKRQIIIAVRNEEPFESMLYEVPRWRIEQAQEFNAAALREIAHCFDLRSWHTAGWGVRNVLEFDHLMPE